MNGTGYNTTNIGENAGKVWQVLSTNGGRQLETIAQQTSLPTEQAYLALGWLARENKINFAPKGRYTYVELTKTERDACATCKH
jgi:hypothetical protein